MTETGQAATVVALLLLVPSLGVAAALLARAVPAQTHRALARTQARAVALGAGFASLGLIGDATVLLFGVLVLALAGLAFAPARAERHEPAPVPRAPEPPPAPAPDPLAPSPGLLWSRR